MLYPIISNATMEEQQKDAISVYESEIAGLGGERIEKMLEDARVYNEGLFKRNSGDKTQIKEYRELLNPIKGGMMGYIEIPKIDVKLPVFHGTKEQELEKGVGHIEGSSLPVGGANTHSLLAGHRGTPEAELFVRLGELEEGDLFTVKICGIESVYEVCAIHTIQPHDSRVLKIQQGRDLLSLITCTPYGINTHRLVVTGERKEAI